MLIEPQEAIKISLEKGVKWNASEMIDSTLKTLGYADGRWIHLKLPRKKTTHKIVIRVTNITDALIFHKLEQPEISHAVAQVQNNRSSVIVIRTTAVPDKLHIYVVTTSDDKREAAEYLPRYGISVQEKNWQKPFAYEVELYGIVSKDKK